MFSRATAKCLESGLNLMSAMLLLVRSVWRTDLLTRLMRWISPSALAASRRMPLGERASVVKSERDSTGRVSEVCDLRS